LIRLFSKILDHLLRSVYCSQIINQ